MALRDSPSAALFRRRNDPSQTGAQGSPSAERPHVDPGNKSPGEVLACKVVVGAAAAYVGGLATPAVLGTTGAAAAAKATAGGLGTAAGLTICENAPPSADQGAGGAPGAR